LDGAKAEAAGCDQKRADAEDAARAAMDDAANMRQSLVQVDFALHGAIYVLLYGSSHFGSG
jgi:hypothetical protein